MPDSEPRLLVDAKIATGTGWAEAILLDGGRVVACGTEPEVRRVAPVGVRTDRCRGRLIVPGLIDPHLHWLASALDARGIDLRTARSMAEVRRGLEEGARRIPSGPLVGGGWSEDRLTERRPPTADDLARADVDRPVVLFRQCHHVATLNRAALAIAGLERSDPDPVGGRLGREADGTPNGLLYESALRRVQPLLIDAFVASWPLPAHLLRRFAVRGLTAVGAMSALATEERIAAERLAPRRLPLAVRFFRLASEPSIAGAPPPDLDRDLATAGTKIVLDGSLGARTAWLEAPYADGVDRGGPVATDEELEAALTSSRALGRTLAVHAIGDRAVRHALDALERVPGAAPARLEHASVLPPPLQDRLRSGRVRLVVQPSFAASDGPWIANRLGAERAPHAYPWRALLDRGVRLAGSSDAPIESFDPWIGMRDAVRVGRLVPHEALDMYAGAAAVALGEPSRGALRAGGPADLVIVDAVELGDAIERGGPVREVVRAGRSITSEAEA